MKTAAQALAKYGTNGASAAAAALWSSNYSANIPGIMNAAAAAGPTWQANTNTPQALTNYQAGLRRVAANPTPVATKVAGVGQASFKAGVAAAAAPNGNYALFIGNWMTAVASEVTTLNTTNPRGTRAENRARQSVYDTWIDSQAGKFRVK